VLALLAALALAPAASAGPSRQQRAASSTSLARMVGNLDRTTAHRYGARDDRGDPLEGLKVVQVGDRYVGVYHAPGRGRFNVHVATSTDLIEWKSQAMLDEDASQPTIAALPGGAILVAYEKTTLLDLLPRTPLPEGLASTLSVFDSPLNRIRLRFRYYRSVDALLAGEYSRQFTARRSLAKTAEGTPSITKATLRGGLTSRSRIEVGMHYFADTDGDGKPDLDRQATGVLTNFNSWAARPRPDFDDDLLRLTSFHRGFTAPPSGSIGDRDQVILDGVRLEVQEAQYIPGDYTSWRLFLVDPRTRAAQPLEVTTGGGSRSFGNPTVTALTSPDGRPALFVSLYVFSEGAAASEAGPLLYYVER
jgi:hypothetical protein